eukprot:COSAG01_NODE_9_length_43729_cov_66.133463_16_plen_204_part_00
MKTIAVAKGYLFKEALALLEQAGLFFDEATSDSRLLSFVDRKREWRLFSVRPWDVPVYVARGAADFGIVGKDVLEEQQSNVAVLKDLGFGHCSLILAARKEQLPLKLDHNIRVATKYPNCAEAWFLEQGIKVRLVKLYGAIELAPDTGLSDIICDLTATGATLRENGLDIMETLFSSTAQLVANASAMAFYQQDIKDIMNAIS